MNLADIVRLAFEAVLSNKLRTILTMLIIGVGIMALVGILTSIDGIKSSLNNNFNSLGANTFNIERKPSNLLKENEERKNINFNEADYFKENYAFPSSVTISAMATQIAILKSQYDKTNPNVQVTACDAEYFDISNYELNQGRVFSEQELLSGSNVIVLGNDVVKSIFKNRQSIVGERVSVGSKKYTVIGTLQEKGSSGFMSSDNQAFIPLLNGKNYFFSNNSRFRLKVAVDDATRIDAAKEEAIATMRKARRLSPKEENDFHIEGSEALLEEAGGVITGVTLAGSVIAFITLLGAAVGLMNIMLVSVTERTREIGVSKSIGADKKMVLTQFLMEALVICQLGGFLGIVLGIIAGNAASSAMGGDFIIPWNWMFLGIAICFVVGLISGIYPAYKASQLDPIDALRHE